jgi:hypothetical protein
MMAAPLSPPIMPPLLWDPRVILAFEPSNSCCGSTPKGGLCPRPLRIRLAQPDQTPQALQTNILKELAACKLRHCTINPLLRKLSRACLCDEHHIRQQDRFLRRWKLNVDNEKKRRRPSSPDSSPPPSPTPAPRGESGKELRSTMKQVPFPTYHQKIQPPSFTKPQSQLPTPRTTPEKTELSARRGKTRVPVTTKSSTGKRRGEFPSINALIAMPRRYLSNGTHSSDSESRIPSAPSSEPLRRNRHMNHSQPLAPTPDSGIFGRTPESASTIHSTSLDFGRTSTLPHDALDEVRVLQANIVKNQEKIFADQARIVEILLGCHGEARV